MASIIKGVDIHALKANLVMGEGHIIRSRLVLERGPDLFHVHLAWVHLFD